MNRILVAALILMSIFILYPSASRSILEANSCKLENSNQSTGPMRNMTDAGACDTFDYYNRLRAKRNPNNILTRMNDSADMVNVGERDIRLSDPVKPMWVTLLTPMGQIVAQYNVKGKVSNNQSQLTAIEGAYCKNGEHEWGCTTVKLPGDNGTYGEDEPGIFFFDTRGVFHQWNGLYLLSDAPEQIVDKPLLTYDLSAKPSSSFDIK